MNLAKLGEDRLLAQLLPRLPRPKTLANATGDDCAIVKLPSREKLLVLKTDCVIEHIHFSSQADAFDVGWKAMMRPLSDFAAASAIPKFALVTLIVPKRTNSGWVTKLYRGLRRAGERFRVNIVGGETSCTFGPITLSVSIAGFVEENRWTSRRGGNRGDDLFVTGRLGGAIKGKHLRFVPRIKESRWLTEHFTIHAMMDLSDGLGADLPRLARASKVGFKIDIDRLPLNPGVKIENAVSDGEDYELLFAIFPRQRDRLQKAWRKKFPDVPLTRIGNLTSNIKHQTLPGGYVHFQ